MNGEPIVPDRDSGGGDLLSSRIKSRRPKLDLVRLPLPGGQAVVRGGGALPIESPAVVVLALEAERIENLHLVPALHVDPGIAAGLASGGGHGGRLELDVQQKVAERAGGFTTNLQQPLGREPGSFELGRRAPIEQHDRPGGRDRTDGGAGAVDGEQAANLATAVVEHLHRLTQPDVQPVGGLEFQQIVLPAAGAGEPPVDEPPLAGEPATILHPRVLPFTQVADLQPDGHPPGGKQETAHVFALPARGGAGLTAAGGTGEPAEQGKADRGDREAEQRGGREHGTPGGSNRQGLSNPTGSTGP